MTRFTIALALAALFGFGSVASALEGRDGDNHPIPGYSENYPASSAQRP
jgi:hypothetical protein